MNNRYKIDRERYSESYIERKGCEYAEGLGWLQYKFTSPGCRAVPDRLYLRAGLTVFIEYKEPGKKPTRTQQRRLQEIRKAGHIAKSFDSIRGVCAFFDKLEVQYADHFAEFAAKQEDELDGLI